MTLDYTRMTEAQLVVFGLGGAMWAFNDRGWTMDYDETPTLSLLWHEGGNDGFVQYTVEGNGTIVKSQYNFTQEMWLPVAVDVPMEESE